MLVYLPDLACAHIVPFCADSRHKVSLAVWKKNKALGHFLLAFQIRFRSRFVPGAAQESGIYLTLKADCALVKRCGGFGFCLFRFRNCTCALAFLKPPYVLEHGRTVTDLSEEKHLRLKLLNSSRKTSNIPSTPWQQLI
jgi:hypothetical protein